jgi:hypothetical protein
MSGMRKQLLRDCGGGMRNSEEEEEEVLKIAALIKPLLAGKEPQVQSAVLAELLSIWLAGHFVEGDAEQTRELRSELLANHCMLVRQLVMVNDPHQVKEEGEE